MNPYDVVEWTWTIAMLVDAIASGWLTRQGVRDMAAASAAAHLAGNARRGIFAAMLTRHSGRSFVLASLFALVGIWSVNTPNPPELQPARIVTGVILTLGGVADCVTVLLDVVDRRRIRKYGGRKADKGGVQ